MGDVKRYYRSITTGDSTSMHQVVLATDYDAALAREAALREELATAKRNEHNSEVAYKAAIEKQEELRGERNELALSASRLKVDNENYDRLLVRKSNQCDEVQQRLTAAEQRNAEWRELLRVMTNEYACCLEAGYDRITSLRGDCDSVAKMLADNPNYAKAIAALAKPTESGASG